MTQPSNTAATPKAYPTHKLYRVVKGRTPEDRSVWSEVAICWPHKDGSGFTVKFKFNETPINGAEYVMRRDTRHHAASKA